MSKTYCFSTDTKGVKELERLCLADDLNVHELLARSIALYGAVRKEVINGRTLATLDHNGNIAMEFDWWED